MPRVFSGPEPCLPGLGLNPALLGWRNSEGPGTRRRATAHSAVLAETGHARETHLNKPCLQSRGLWTKTGPRERLGTHMPAEVARNGDGGSRARGLWYAMLLSAADRCLAYHKTKLPAPLVLIQAVWCNLRSPSSSLPMVQQGHSTPQRMGLKLEESAGGGGGWKAESGVDFSRTIGTRGRIVLREQRP